MPHKVSNCLGNPRKLATTTAPDRMFVSGSVCFLVPGGLLQSLCFDSGSEFCSSLLCTSVWHDEALLRVGACGGCSLLTSPQERCDQLQRGYFLRLSTNCGRSTSKFAEPLRVGHVFSQSSSATFAPAIVNSPLRKTSDESFSPLRHHLYLWNKCSVLLWSVVWRVLYKAGGVSPRFKVEVNRKCLSCFVPRRSVARLASSGSRFQVWVAAAFFRHRFLRCGSPISEDLVPTDLCLKLLAIPLSSTFCMFQFGPPRTP